MKMRITHERTVNTYAEHWHASYVMMRIAKEFGKGQFYLYQASIMYSAFTLEAYLNHVGPRVIPGWGQKLPKLNDKSMDDQNWRTKLKSICQMLGCWFPEGWGHPLLQGVVSVFEFRNQIAHSRSIEFATFERTVEGEGSIPSMEEITASVPPEMMTEWEKKLRDDSFAVSARERVEEVVRRIHLHRKDPDKEPVFHFGGASYSASAVEPPELP